MTKTTRRLRLLVLGPLVAVGVVAVAPSGAGASAPKAPSVRSVSPDNGPVAGGTFVTIKGNNFDGATAVNFGGNAAPVGWFVRSSDSIQAIAPAGGGTGAVVVTVTTPNGTSSTTPTPTNVFNYVTGPTIQSVYPGGGTTLGGTIVTISGVGFSSVTSVTFNGVAATTYLVDSPTEITATTPGPGSGNVPVVVTASGQNTPPDPAAVFDYVSKAPVVNLISPPTGTAGTVVTIEGSLFQKKPTGATTVYFGATPATGVTVVNGKTLTAVAPATSGTVDITVVDPSGTSAINEPADLFTYTS